MSAEEAAEATGIAYIGEVVATPATERAKGTMLEREVVVVVTEPIVGVAEGTELRLKVLMGMSAGCGIEYPFTVGDQWLFFGADDYRLTLCSPDRPVDEAERLAPIRMR